MAFREIKTFTNEAAPLLSEYTLRKRLSDIGYRFDPNDISVFKLMRSD
jgi:hypothetical protein